MALSLLLLDTNAVIYIVGEVPMEPPPDGPYGVSVITEIEVLGYHLLDEENEARMRAFLNTVEVLPLTGEVKDRAIALRRHLRLKTPDAIIAATALTLGANIVSNDEGLDRVQGLNRIPLQLKS